MARKHYYLSFRDRVVVYALHDHAVPTRIIEKYQLELMNLMLLNVKEAAFSCTDEEFFKRLTPTMLANYKRLKSNDFKIKEREESLAVLEGG
jgi:hypothetical protein